MKISIKLPNNFISFPNCVRIHQASYIILGQSSTRYLIWEFVKKTVFEKK